MLRAGVQAIQIVDHVFFTVVAVLRDQQTDLYRVDLVSHGGQSSVELCGGDSLSVVLIEIGEHIKEIDGVLLRSRVDSLLNSDNDIVFILGGFHVVSQLAATLLTGNERAILSSSRMSHIAAQLNLPSGWVYFWTNGSNRRRTSSILGKFRED